MPISSKTTTISRIILMGSRPEIPTPGSTVDPRRPRKTSNTITTTRSIGIICPKSLQLIGGSGAGCAADAEAGAVVVGGAHPPAFSIAASSSSLHDLEMTSSSAHAAKQN
jgi:hypothetical protein